MIVHVGHWLHFKIWELKLDSLQLLLGKRSGQCVFVGDMGSDVFLGTKFLRLLKGDKPPFKLGSEDTFRRPEVVVVDIGHEGDEFVCERCRGVERRGNGRLACASSAYMHFCCGVLIFKLPYCLICMYVLLVDPLIVQVRVALPFDKVLQFSSSAKLLRI